VANVMAERTWFIVTSKEGLVLEGCDYGVLLNTGSPHTGPQQVREAWQEQFILSQAELGDPTLEGGGPCSTDMSGPE
jgi:hypothetical protein